MGQSDDVEDSTFMKHQELCSRLNMDASAATESWKSYENIRQHYTLEGDQLHWIGCALYVACRKASTPTVGKTANIQGNCVSLTQLLRLCNLPLIEFFAKSKAWADMCNMPQDFGARIETLQRNFSVSSVIFQKYQPIFKDIFHFSTDDLNKPSRSRRHRTVPCTPSRLFEFCWSLFICIKSGISNDLSDDLVNSYHLLLVCCDLMYSNALLDNRKDLLNPNFPGLPENFNDDDFTPPETVNCIVNLLCERHSAIAVEAILIKEYSLKRYLTKLFNEKIIRGDVSNFSGILDQMNFDGNNKAVNKAYAQHVLSVGDLDERIFLGPDSDSSIGSSPSKIVNMSDLHEYLSKKEHPGTIQHWSVSTPLTCRKFLKTKDVTNIAPASNPTQSVIRLNSLLIGCQTNPSEKLRKIFKSSSSDTQNFVETKIQEFGKMFYDAYLTKAPEQLENSGFDFGKKRLQSAQTLFYKILELVLNDELIKKPNFDISELLNNDNFLQCLFACTCEIVIYSYQNKDKTFPWILKALNLEAYNFYRVIEVIIRVSVDQLTRDMVKHLSRIEEMILESLAWKSTSPLWQAIADCKDGIPSYEDVALPGTFDIVDPSTPGQPALRRFALDKGAHHDILQSPISSASERFQPPRTISSDVKKKLFADPSSPTQSVLKVGSSSCTQKNSSVSSSPMKNRDQIKPRKMGSLSLFFRKFYHMTVTRMQTLCTALMIADVDLKRKIWTIFEYSIMRRTPLMKDRHLDQILMSAVYVICKLCKIEKNTFTEIMRCYRSQPQAESHIYRSVLISYIQNDTEPALENNHSESNQEPPPTPSDMAATSRIYGKEERGDLIKFYNTVYVPEVKVFAEQFSTPKGNSNPNLTLSPLPKVRPAQNASPIRRVTESVMTRVLDPKEIVASPAPQLRYCFNRSPAKDLETINRMVTSVDARKYVSKRLLSDETDLISKQPDTEPKNKKVMTATATAFVAKKLENIIGDRCIQNP